MTKEDALPPKAMHSALSIIHAEHQGHATVLNALMRHLKPVRENRLRPDYDLFATILSYVDTFMDRFHHPKEDEYLFRAVRSRTSEADETLLELQHEHARGPAEIRALNEALRRTRSGIPADIDAFAALLERYAAGQHEHMRKEGNLITPIAQRVLTATDWETIDSAFRDNSDPYFGPGRQGRVGSLFKPMYGFPSGEP